MPKKQAPQSRTCILIADSDPHVRRLAAEVVEKLGYAVLLASHGREALQLAFASGCNIALLATSVALPCINGLELAKRLREKFPALRVIYMSARHDEVRVNAPIHPGSMPLLKPFTCEQLGFELGALIGEIERQQPAVQSWTPRFPEKAATKS